MRRLFQILATATFAFAGVSQAVGAAVLHPTLSMAEVEIDAASGDPEAIATLGWIHEIGKDVAADPRRAATLYRQAADKGDPFAQWRLGAMIDEGKAHGSPVEAVLLFRKAAAQKSPNAMASLGVMYAGGRGVARDYDAAMRYYQAAARMGSAHGLEGIGVLYANGQGVARDMGEALAHWLVAAAAGDADATALLLEYMPASGTAEAAPIYARAHSIADAYGVGSSGDDRNAGIVR